jgi:hypothetical protein
MISARHLPLTCVLLAAALVPTIIHSYSGRVFVDGRSTAAIAATLDGFAGVPTDRNESWGKRRFDSDDWMERSYERAGDAVRLTVVRTYDAKSVYHHPELAVSYGTSFAGLDTRRPAQRPDVPLHILRPSPGVKAIGMYVLHYDDRFVDNPVLFQIRTAGELLFSQRKPMTLFFAFDPNGAEAGVDTPEQLAATRLLLAAVDSFLAQPTADAAAR